MKNRGLTARFICAKIFVKRTSLLSAVICAAMCLTVGWAVGAVPAQAQQTPATGTASATTAKIHGHAQNPLALPITDATVELTTDGKTVLYSFKTDANGDFSGSGIKPGTYIVLLHGTIQGKNGQPQQGTIDFQRNVKFTAGVDTEVNFDLSRQSYVSKLPPEMQKKIAEAKKQNQVAEAANAKIKNVNKLITQARVDRKSGNFDQAIALDTQATQAKPDVGLTWYELGDSYLAAKKYPDAATNYKKAISVMGTEKTPPPAVVAAADNNLGEALADSGNVPEAVSAYEAAAKADPTQADKYYKNEAIVLFKTGKGDEAGAAADKAIAANPNDAIPYYIKGWSLVQHATVDSKTGKIVLPPGCADAYHKFLQLQPTGPLAEDAKNILEQAGEKVHSSYKKH